MNVKKYQERLITWFKSGNATDKHYKEMAIAIIIVSTWLPSITTEIDEVIRVEGDND